MRKCLQRRIQVQQFHRDGARPRLDLHTGGQRQGLPTRFPSSLLRRPAPRVVHQHLPHHARGHCQEMGPVAEGALPLAGKLQVDLMNQRRRLQRVPGTLAAQVPRSYTAQFAVERRDQFVERPFVSGARSLQQFGQADSHAT